MNSYYIFVRVKKAIKSRLFTLEHTFSGLVSRENVKIRDIFLQHLSTPESIVPSPTAEAVSPKILQRSMGF